MDHRSIREILAALRERRLSAVELLDQAIARIERHDTALNAVAVRDFERARRAAAAADAALARGERRPLLGLPITVKECFDVEGLATTWGIPGTETLRAQADAVAVRRLKAAGAVVMGKTNLALQLADWQSANPLFGVTRNPWDLGRTPGGSSGGSAAALAAGYVALELGSDLAGSLRVPAHCCGVFAHKPSHGIVPMRGMAPPGTPWLSVSAEVDLAVVGPMARSADDLELALDVLAGPDEAEAVAWRLELPPARHAALADFRVLVLDTHPQLPSSQAVRARLEHIAEGLARAGCEVGRASPLLPDLKRVAATWGTLVEALVSADIPDAPSISHRDWIQADRLRAGIAHQWRQFFSEWDVVLCPVLPITAFAHDQCPMEKRQIEIDGQAVPYEALGLWSSVATLTGLPATAMPIGLAEDGLPVGMQIVGPRLEDRSTLGFARLVEREFGGFVAPPGLAS